MPGLNLQVALNKVCLSTYQDWATIGSVLSISSASLIQLNPIRYLFCSYPEIDPPDI